MISKIDNATYRVERALVVVALAIMALTVFVEVIHRRLVAQESAIAGLLTFPKKLSIGAAVNKELAGAPPTTIAIEVERRIKPTRDWYEENLSPPLLALLLALMVLFGLRTAQRVSPRDGSAVEAPGDVAGEGELGAGVQYLLTALVAFGVGYLLLRAPPKWSWITLAAVGLLGSAGSWALARLRTACAAAALSCGVALLGKVMVSAQSRWTYVILVGVAGTMVVKRHLASDDGQAKRRAVIAAAGAVFGVLLAYLYVPEGFGWAKELAIKVLLMWVAFLGASMATYARRHIMVDFVRKLVPEKYKQAYEALSALLAAIVSTYLAYLAYIYVFGPPESGSIYQSGSTLENSDIPAWFGMAAIPLGLTTTALRFLGMAVQAFRGELAERDPLEGLVGERGDEPAAGEDGADGAAPADEAQR